MGRAMLAVLALIGCNGNQPTDETVVPPAPPVDTGTEDGFFPANCIYLNAELAFDGVRPVVADVQGNATPPLVLITLATEDWDNSPNDVENYCVIGIPLTQATDRNVSADPRLWFGVDWAPSLDPVLTTCNTPGYELNPRRWGVDPVAQLTNGVGYFVAVGAMTPYVAEAVKSQAPDLDLIGGSIGLPDFFAVEDGSAGRVDHVYTFAFEMDEAGRLPVENGALIEIPSGELAADPFRPAFYSMTSLFFWKVP